MADDEEERELLYSPRLEGKATNRLRRSRPPPPLWLALVSYALVGIFVAVLYGCILIVQRPSHVLPTPPTSASEPATEFSEAGAYVVLDELFQIGYNLEQLNRNDSGLFGIAGRLSMSPTIYETAQYLENKLKDLNVAYPTAPIDIEVAESEGTRLFPSQSFLISYSNVTNVMARLNGSDADAKAILISAHFDTAPNSPGASSNAAAVATAFEVLRVLMARKQESNTLSATIIVLFDDAKEGATLGIDAFARHPWFQSVGVYINLDSLGGWGRPLLTQLGPNNDWLASVFKRTVPYAEASVIATELFESYPTTTNFNIFTQLGIPGVEFDLYRNGYIYNTPLDVLDTYENGTLYAFGQNVLAFVSGVSSADEFQNVQRLEGQSRTTATYYDVLLGPVVAYAPTTANVLAALSTILTAMIFSAGLYLYNRQSRLEVSDRVIGIALQMLFTVIFLGFDFFISILTAAVFGVIIDQVNPLAWYSNVPVGSFGIGLWAVVSSNFFLLAHASGLHWFRWPLWNRGYGGPIVINEVFVAVGVQTIFTLFLIVLTASGLGGAYLPFWYCMCFNIAGLGAVVYFGIGSSSVNKQNFDTVEPNEIYHRPSTNDGSPAANIIRFPYPAQTVPQLSRNDLIAWTLFYLTWALFPTLLTLNLAYSSSYSIIPVLSRLGVPQGETYLGLLIGLIYGTFAMAILAPWFSLLQRYQHRSILSALLGVAALIALLIGMFATAPFTETRPRQVEVLHYIKVNPTDPAASIASITLTAPNPAKLTHITNEMTVFTNWTECEAVAYRFLYQKGLCLVQDQPVGIPNITLPTLQVLSFNNTGTNLTITWTISAQGNAALLMRFNGTLQSWSLGTIPPKGPQGTFFAGYNFPGYVDVPDGYAILYRSLLASQTITATFDTPEPGEAIHYEVWSNVYAISELQKLVIENLPPWATVWGKSNVPGPIVSILSGTFSPPSQP